MNKLLKEIRKGEDDNVLPFDAIPKPDRKPPEGGDWLRTLPSGTRFLATKKGVQQPFAEMFGVGHIDPAGVMLACESEYGPGLQWRWANSPVFSQRYILLGVLPQMEVVDEPDNPS
jgi:hypothetical protein